MGDTPNASPFADKARWTGVAADYERWGESFTAQYSRDATVLAGGFEPGQRVLDVAAGTGALSLIAAAAGASVLATDFAPGMVERLAERLAVYPNCAARVMNGEALDVADESFDASFSMFGVMAFPDWRRGLRELIRATRPGGRIVVASWANIDGAGPMVPFLSAFRSTFPGKTLPTPLAGVVALSSTASMRKEMIEAGCTRVDVHEVEGTWGGASLASVLTDVFEARRLLPLYAALDEDEVRRLAEPMQAALAVYVTSDGTVAVSSTANIAIAFR